MKIKEIKDYEFNVDIPDVLKLSTDKDCCISFKREFAGERRMVVPEIRLDSFEPTNGKVEPMEFEEYTIPSEVYAINFNRHIKMGLLGDIDLSECTEREMILMSLYASSVMGKHLKTT